MPELAEAVVGATVAAAAQEPELAIPAVCIRSVDSGTAGRPTCL